MNSFTKASAPSKGTSAFSGGSIKSPSNTPEEQQKTLGGMPPEKSIKEINNANDPAKRGPAPNVSRGT